MNDQLTKNETQDLLDDNPHLGIIDRHAESVSKAKLVLILLCCVAIIASFVWSRIELNGANGRITKVESPCLRYGSQSKACHESFQAAINSITDYQLCVLLAKRPDLTNVAFGDCRRIARNQHRRGTEVIGQSGVQPGQRLRGSRSPAQPEKPQPEANSAPSGDGGLGKSTPDHPEATPGQPQTPQSPESQGSPSHPEMAPASQNSSPSNPPASSVSPPSSSEPESAPSKPPVVGVEAPVVPAHGCAPGLLSVNC